MVRDTTAAWKRPRYWTRKTRCPGGESWRPSEYTNGGMNWTGTPAWTSQLSSSNWCYMIQKGHVTPTATSYHPLTKAERFCRKFGNFFHHYLTLCVECFIRNYVSRVQKYSLPKYSVLITEVSFGNWEHYIHSYIRRTFHQDFVSFIEGCPL